MARLERKIDLGPVSVDKGLLEEFNQSFQHLLDPQRYAVQATLSLDGDAWIFDSLPDLLRSSLLPDNVDSITLRYSDKGRTKKGISLLQLYMSPKNETCYAQIIGYNDGQIESALKMIEQLFDKKRQWYHLNYQYPIMKWIITGTFLVGTPFLAVRIARLAGLFSQQTDNRFWVGVAGFVFGAYSLNKLSQLFPYVEWDINQPQRRTFFRSALVALTLSLAAGLIIEGIHSLL